MVCYNIDMFVELEKLLNRGDVVAVAISGGKDSVCLLHYLNANCKKVGYSLCAINVEHGIRGIDSINDSNFVKSFCESLNVPLYCYSVDAPKHSQENGLSIEESARILRYECFYDLLNKKLCTKIATAHHLLDNAESVLFNVFRGTGIRGASGITQNFNDQIIRPFLTVKREQIDQYVNDFNLPFVTDQTNFDDDYTRNAIRHKVIPVIEQLFPNATESIKRFSDLARLDDEFITQTAQDLLGRDGQTFYINLPCHKAVFSRACILALKGLGVQKDWEKTHIDGVYSLCEKQNGASVNLPKGIVAVKENERIVFYKPTTNSSEILPFSLGKHLFNGQTITLKRVEGNVDLKSGLFIDYDKVPKTAVIRTFKVGDEFKKFGGGTKSLGDYFTDLKIPKRLRETLPLLVDGNTVYAIFGVAISDLSKVDENTKNIVKLL
ncbi:MAG: tRNA lysidine(34) synthetase TilS [Clostridia bacterium]|nr:tRNA lysidine(34) synthetase TilS [Clostridia bacterium]